MTGKVLKILGFLCYLNASLVAPLFSQHLKTGDTIPTINFTNVVNNSTGDLNFSAYKGKLIIMDFWSHYCLSCLTGLPKIDSLQNEFGEQVQFIMVNREGKEKTEKFRDKKKYLKWPDVPMITNDSILHSWFPAKGYPYHVWVNPQGRVEYVTMAYNTTRENISRYLSKERVQLKSIYEDDNNVLAGAGREHVPLNNEHLLYGSFIYRGESADIPDRYASNIAISTMSIKKSSILKLFIRAYSEGERYNFNPVYATELQVDSPFNYRYPEDDNIRDYWMKQHAYNYMLILPLVERSVRQRKMQEDLQSYFNLEAQIVKRKVNGYALVKLAGYRERASKKDSSFSNMSAIGEGTDTVCRLYNRPFSELVTTIQSWMWLQYPFENRTGIEGNIDIELNCSSLYPLNIVDLKRALKKHRLDLRDTLIETDVLVIRKKSGG